MKIIDKLAWIEIRDGRVLSTRSRGKDTYYLPGGKREAGETDAETLLREIKEELDVTLNASSLQYIGAFQAQAHGHTEGIKVKMQCYSAQYEGTIKASSEIEEVIWLSYSDKDKVSAVDKIIFDWLKEEGMLR
jgi:8-oxo-dGTP diphosphatase